MIHKGPYALLGMKLKLATYKALSAILSFYPMFCWCCSCFIISPRHINQVVMCISHHGIWIRTQNWISNNISLKISIFDLLCNILDINHKTLMKNKILVATVLLKLDKGLVSKSIEQIHLFLLSPFKITSGSTIWRSVWGVALWSGSRWYMILVVLGMGTCL